MTIYGVFSLLGGVGLFLFGMTVMSTGLKNACGDDLQVILQKATKNRVIAVAVGMAMTMLIQSSSATDVMVIGFVNSGMLSLGQAIGVILGANIGTTITAQITAFDLSAYAPVLLFAGTVMYLFLKRDMIKHIGSIIMGFGMLFVGISIMKEAILPLQSTPGFIHMLSGLDNPWLALLFGVAFTALLQSSSSATVIFQTFAVQGLLNYQTAVYLVIGAAIGSVTPNLLASLTTNRNGKRAALSNLLFNLFRAVFLIALIQLVPGLLDLIQSLSPGNVGRQIANTHTIFAILAVVVGLPFTNQIVKLTERILRILPEENERMQERKLQYMTNLKSMPASLAVSQAQREVTRMGRIAAKNLRRAVDCFFAYDEKKAESVRSREESVNILNHSIEAAMTQMRNLELSQDGMRRISMMMVSLTDIERLSDHAENIIEYILELRREHSHLSPVALKELQVMAEETLESVDLAIDIFETENYEQLDRMEYLENHVDDLKAELIARNVERLSESHCQAISGVVFTDIVTDLERCSDHAINLAYALKERPKDDPRVDPMAMQ